MTAAKGVTQGRSRPPLVRPFVPAQAGIQILDTRPPP